MDAAPDHTPSTVVEPSAELLDAIDAIYATVTDPSALDTLPERLASLLRAQHVTLWCIDTDLQPIEACNFGLSSAGVMEYLDGWMYNDPLMDTALQRFVGKTSTPDRVLGEGVFRQLPVFEGFYEKHDMVRAMARFDRIGAQRLAGLVFQRGERDRDPDSNDEASLEICARHLRRAWKLRIAMGLLEARSRSAESLLAQCRLATWLVDRKARIHAANAAAEALQARPESGLRSTNARLGFHDEPLNSALQSALRTLADGGRQPIELPFGNRPRGAIAWGVVSGPGCALQLSGISTPLYLVALAERGATCQPEPTRLRERLPVSRVESEVLAALMCGSEPPTIARDRGSTLETIRGYEKSLRTRLRCNSRAQLVARGWRALAVLPTLDATRG